MEQGQPDNFDAFMDLGAQDIARLVLCLLIEEALEGRLAAFRYGSGQIDRGAPTRMSALPSRNTADILQLDHAHRTQGGAAY